MADATEWRDCPTSPRQRSRAQDDADLDALESTCLYVASGRKAVSVDSDKSAASYWSTNAPVGTPAAWAFSGPDGLRRLSGPATFLSDDEERFRARLTRVQLDHVALEAFAATQHRYVRSPEQVRDSSTAIVMFVLLAEGHLSVETTGGGFALESGQCVLVDSRESLSYTTLADVRILRTVVGIEHIPAGSQRRGMSLTGPLPRTPLIDSFIAFVSSTLKSSTEGRPAQSVHLVRAIAALQNSVLAEAQEVWSHDPADETLLHLIEDHIEQHLAEPDLGPRSIAAALGISLRHAHGSFNRDHQTIGRYIREHRLSAVAIELQRPTPPPDLEDLAARYGFSSANALRRAFRSQYGLTPSDYHLRGHQALG